MASLPSTYQEDADYYYDSIEEESGDYAISWDYPVEEEDRPEPVRPKRFQQQVNSGLVGLTRPRFGKRNPEEAVIDGMDKKNFLRLTMPRFGKRSPKIRDDSDASGKKVDKQGSNNCIKLRSIAGKRSLTMAYLNSLTRSKQLPKNICLDDLRYLMPKRATIGDLVRPRFGKRGVNLEDLVRPRFGKRVILEELVRPRFGKRGVNLEDLVRPRFGKRGVSLEDLVRPRFGKRGVNLEDLVRPRFGKRAASLEDLARLRLGLVPVVRSLDDMYDDTLRMYLSPFGLNYAIHFADKRTADAEASETISDIQITDLATSAEGESQESKLSEPASQADPEVE